MRIFRRYINHENTPQWCQNLRAEVVPGVCGSGSAVGPSASCCDVITVLTIRPDQNLSLTVWVAPPQVKHGRHLARHRHGGRRLRLHGAAGGGVCALQDRRASG